MIVPPTSSAIELRWFIGLGTGTDPAQIAIEQSVADDFNASHPNIQVVLEVVPYVSARDTLAAEIAAGAGPDVVGPVGWIASNAFHGEWLDLAPYITSSGFDTSVFTPALVDMYDTDEGQVSLPFAVYPSAIYYNADLFTEASLNPPPVHYGDQYQMPGGAMLDWNWDTLAQVARLLTIDSTGKNATEAGFDVTEAVQYGFSFQWEGHPNYWGTFQTNGGQILVPGGSPGSCTAQIPDGWKAAWQWVYDGIWGAQPFIPNGAVASGADYESGNVFASGKVAMVDMPSWYLCCIGNLVSGGGEFDFGVMPVGRDGAVAGRVDADSFQSLERHPASRPGFRVPRLPRHHRCEQVDRRHSHPVACLRLSFRHPLLERPLAGKSAGLIPLRPELEHPPRRHELSGYPQRRRLHAQLQRCLGAHPDFRRSAGQQCRRRIWPPRKRTLNRT